MISVLRLDGNIYLVKSPDCSSCSPWAERSDRAGVMMSTGGSRGQDVPMLITNIMTSLPA